MKYFKAVLVAMSGVRVYNNRLMEIGLTLPGFVERSKVIASLPSLGLLTLAAHTPPHWEVVYVELDLVTETTVEELIRMKPDLVAFSSLTARINETYQLADRLRMENIKVAIGGLHVSAVPEEGMMHADCIVQGEGELIWPALLSDLEKDKLRPLYSSLREKTLAFHLTHALSPRYDLLDVSRYNRLTLQTTRGCPLHCSFCAASRTISTYKKKPVELIEKELQSIFEIWERPFIELADDNTFVDKAWSAGLLRMFAKHEMKWFTETDISIAYDDQLLELLARSNCAQVLIGFETSQPAGLRGLDRSNWKYRQFDRYLAAIEKIQSFGISVNGCFIVGLDADTPASLFETEQFIRNSGLAEVQITLLTPFPGTSLYRQLQSENRLIAENFWDKCTLFDLNFIPKNFSVNELELHFQAMMQNVYAENRVRERKSIFRNILKNKLTALPYEYYSDNNSSPKLSDKER